MEIIYLAIAILVVLIIKVMYDRSFFRDYLDNKIKDRWGKITTEEYSDEKYKSLQLYFLNHKDEKTDIDDITWNDLNMDELFMMINNTSSAFGEEYLYALLRKPQFNNEVLQERDRVIEYFMKNKETRFRFQKTLLKLGKMKDISIYEYVNRTDDIVAPNKWMHIFCPISFILAMSTFFVNIGLGVILSLAALAHNVYRYYKVKARIENYFTVFSYILKTMNCVEELEEIPAGELKDYLSGLNNAKKQFASMRRGSKLVIAGSQLTGSLSDSIMDWFRMLLHIDLLKFGQMVKEVRKHKEEFNFIFEKIGYLDAMIAVASFRTWLDEEYCKPELIDTKKPILEAEDLYHPLIKNPVVNSITEYRSVLITGSNASGKSTFLKTVAVNAILSQTIYTSLSSSYRASFFKILSSMSLRDDIFSSESYYIVEIKSLKRIIDQLDENIPVLCFVDEVLRGTNTLERIAASSQILMSFARSNALCFAATHDIELTHILENYYSNYHFQEEFKDDTITFNYQLFKGRATSKNAINLLKMIGYDDTIISSAKDMANEFLKNGVWADMK